MACTLLSTVAITVICVCAATGQINQPEKGALPGTRRGVIWKDSLDHEPPEDQLNSVMDKMLPPVSALPESRVKRSADDPYGYKAQIQTLYSGWLQQGANVSSPKNAAAFNGQLKQELTKAYYQLQARQQDPRLAVSSIFDVLANYSGLNVYVNAQPYQKKLPGKSIITTYKPCFCGQSTAASYTGIPVIYNASAFSGNDLRTMISALNPSLDISAFTTADLAAEVATYLPRCAESSATITQLSCSAARSNAVQSAEAAAWLSRSFRATKTNDCDGAMVAFAIAASLDSTVVPNITALVETSGYPAVRVQLALAQLANVNLSAQVYLSLRASIATSLNLWANGTTNVTIRNDLLSFSMDAYREARKYAYNNNLAYHSRPVQSVKSEDVATLNSTMSQAMLKLNVSALRALFTVDSFTLCTALEQAIPAQPMASNSEVLRQVLRGLYLVHCGGLPAEVSIGLLNISSGLMDGGLTLVDLPQYVADLMAWSFSNTRSVAVYDAMPSLTAWLAQTTTSASDVGQLPSGYAILNSCVYPRGVVLKQLEDQTRTNVFVTKIWKAIDAAFEHWRWLSYASTYEEIAFALLDAANWCIYALQNEQLTVAQKYATAKVALDSLQTIWNIIDIYEVPVRRHIAYWAYRFALVAGQYGGSTDDGTMCATYFNMTTEYTRLVANLVPPRVCMAEAVPTRLLWYRFYNSYLNSIVPVRSQFSKIDNATLYYQRFVHKLIHQQDFSADRLNAISELLGERGDSISNTEYILNSPYATFTDGWFTGNKKFLASSSTTGYTSLRGITIDVLTGEFSVMVDQEDGTHPSMFSMDDVSVVFRENPLNSTDVLLFSLDAPPEKPWYYYHPMQEFRYQPASIQYSSVLDTLFRADYILKQLCSGVEVNVKSPFTLRNISLSKIIASMPARLQYALRPLHNRTNGTWNSRVWVQADTVQYTTTQTGTKFTYVLGDAHMGLRTAPLQYSATGMLQNAPLANPDDVVVQFCNDFLANYDEVSGYLPEFKRLKELTKIFALRDILRSFAGVLDAQIAGATTAATRQQWTTSKQNFVNQLAKAVAKASGEKTTWTQNSKTWVPAAFNVFGDSIVYGGIVVNPSFTRYTGLTYPSSSIAYSVFQNLNSPSGYSPLRSSVLSSFSDPANYQQLPQIARLDPYSSGIRAPSGASGYPVSDATRNALYRLVFGEAGSPREPDAGRRAVVDAVLNRLEDPDKYKFGPSGSTTDEKLLSLIMKKNAFSTMSNDDHTANYVAAQKDNTAQYQNVKNTVDNVLAMSKADRQATDVTKGPNYDRPPATNFDRYPSSSSLQDTSNYAMHGDPLKIGNHYFDYYTGPKKQ